MKHIKRILPLVLLIICLCISSFTCNEGSASLDAQGVSLGYIENATISIENLIGTYDICFGDANGNLLSDYTKITTIKTDKNGNAEAIISNLVIPPSAKTLVLLDDGGNQAFLEKSIKLPEECTNFGEEELLFGAISDVHFNRYRSKPPKDDAVPAFTQVLEYFDKVGVDLVGVSGDLSSDGEEVAFIRFNLMVKDKEYEVFSCTGNHDIPAIESGAFKEHILGGIETQNGVLDIAENGLDFTYSESEGEVFIFLSQMYRTYNTPDSRLLDSEQLVWLRGVCEKYKNDRVFLFFHTFLCGTDGQKHTGVGNIKNPGGYTYDLPYTYGTQDEIEFRQILKDYKNVIFFSGHSHWQFEMEKYNEIANFSNLNGEYGYMVHIPSVASPRYIGENDTNRTEMNTKSSQGWLVYVYDECIIFLPIEFTTGVIYTEYMEIISYR